MDNSNSRGKLIYEGIALKSIRTFFNNHVAISSVSDKELTRK